MTNTIRNILSIFIGGCIGEAISDSHFSGPIVFLGIAIMLVFVYLMIRFGDFDH